MLYLWLAHLGSRVFDILASGYTRPHPWRYWGLLFHNRRRQVNAICLGSGRLTHTGTSVIETGATLYTFLAGPPVSPALISWTFFTDQNQQYAASRVLILHVFQALGSVIAPIVVRGISKNGPPAAEWAYLVLAVRSDSQPHPFHLVSRAP